MTKAKLPIAITTANIEFEEDSFTTDAVELPRTAAFWAVVVGLNEVGLVERIFDGFTVGFTELELGFTESNTVGLIEDGIFVGYEDGSYDGTNVGALVVVAVGNADGASVRSEVGHFVGFAVGKTDWDCVGIAVGETDGRDVNATDG